MEITVERFVVIVFERAEEVVLPSFPGIEHSL